MYRKSKFESVQRCSEVSMFSARNQFAKVGLHGEIRAARRLRQASKPLSRSFVFIATALVLLAALPGCATMSEADCLSADWSVMGEVDRQPGRPLSELNRYRRQCAEYGVVPDTQAYMQARERGLGVSCTRGNGYREGRSGASGEPVCPAALEPDFRSGFELGRAVYASLSELRASSDSIGSARGEIEDLRSDIADRQAPIRSADLNEDERRNLRGEIDSMNRRIDRIEDDVVIFLGTAAIAMTQYRNAVEAARAQGYDEPMETELLRELRRLTQ